MLYQLEHDDEDVGNNSGHELSRDGGGCRGKVKARKAADGVKLDTPLHKKQRNSKKAPPIDSSPNHFNETKASNACDGSVPGKVIYSFELPMKFSTSCTKPQLSNPSFAQVLPVSIPDKCLVKLPWTT